MADSCGRPFDEALLSGYLDGALSQGDEQRVRLHVSTCPQCQATIDEMRRLREATMSATFETPTDDQWSEQPRNRVSAVSRKVGWSVIVGWLVGLAGYAAWNLLTSGEPFLAKALVITGWTGFGLLLLSVALDRLRTRKTDRYRGVQK